MLPFWFGAVCGFLTVMNGGCCGVYGRLNSWGREAESEGELGG